VGGDYVTEMTLWSRKGDQSRGGKRERKDRSGDWIRNEKEKVVEMIEY